MASNDRRSATRQGHAPALARVGVAAAAGAVVAVLVTVFGSWQFAPLAGWDALACTFVALTWSSILPLNGERTAQRAAREDNTRPVANVLLLGAAVASLVAVGLVLFRAGQSKGAAKALQVALGIGSVALSWAVVHTTFTLHYAQRYYSGRRGGVNFNQKDAPRYSDFAYLAFTVGMTFQVADTILQNRGLRRLAIGHALMSYLFGTVILATTVNLIAGLSK